MNKSRRVFFIVSLVLVVLMFFVELGSDLVFSAYNAGASRLGLGIRYLALIDGLLLFTMILIAAPLGISHRLAGRLQGIATLLVSLTVLLIAVGMIVVAIALLSIKVALLLAVPFGTIAYFAAFAHFPVGQAAAVLSTIFLLKVGFAASLISSDIRYLQNKGLIVLILISIGLTMLLTFLHGFPPRFLASITDDIGAIITGVVSVLWALIMLIASVPAIVKAFKITDI